MLPYHICQSKTLPLLPSLCIHLFPVNKVRSSFVSSGLRQYKVRTLIRRHQVTRRETGSLRDGSPGRPWGGQGLDRRLNIMKRSRRYPFMVSDSPNLSSLNKRRVKISDLQVPVPQSSQPKRGPERGTERLLVERHGSAPGRGHTQT